MDAPVYNGEPGALWTERGSWRSQGDGYCEPEPERCEVCGQWALVQHYGERLIRHCRACLELAIAADRAQKASAT